MSQPNPVIDVHGTIRWYKNGLRHRIDGPAVTYANGSAYWFQDGKLHRLDGPAAESPGDHLCWYRDGKLHRTNGPACEYASGGRHWYIDDVEYTEEQFRLIVFVNSRQHISETAV